MADRDRILEITREVYHLPIKRLTLNWSVAYDFCLLASGKIDAIIQEGCELYDFIAGKIIAAEAGALITHQDGSKEKYDASSYLVASNGTAIHQKVIEILRKPSIGIKE